MALLKRPPARAAGAAPAAVLPDLLGPGLRVVFCGSAAGRRSAQLRRYYAGPGNGFWAVLARIGLTPEPLAPADYEALLDYGIGLTDLVKHRSGSDAEVEASAADILALRAKIEAFKPQVLAFNGKRAAETFFGGAVRYGRQRERVGESAAFVLPSTSAAARRFWDEGPWLELAEFLRAAPAPRGRLGRATARKGRREMGTFFDAAETLARAERAEAESRALRALVAHAVAHAPAARRLFERAGVDPAAVREAADLARLPITEKEDLPALQRAEPPLGGWQGMPIGQYRYLFLSPGPIMEPAAGPGYWRTARAFHAAGFRAGDIVLNTFAYHLTPAGQMGDDGIHPLGAVVVPGGVGNTETQARLLEQAGVTGFFGIPSFLVTILEKAEELTIVRARRRLARALVSGEIFPASTRARLKEAFGVDAYQAYITADLGLVAYECQAQDGMHVADDLLVEVVDLERGRPVGAGELGEVVGTAIGTLAYPLIRFGTGDLSLFTDEPCRCGRTSRRLVRLAGRVGDAVKVRGMFVHGREADAVMAEFPAVARYRLVVTRSGQHDVLACEVELRGPADEAALARDLGARLRDVLKLRVDTVTVVPPGTFPERYKRLDDRRVWA